MLSLRSPLILAAAPMGMVLAALAWFVVDAGAPITAPLDRLEARLDALRPARAGVAKGPSASPAKAPTIFALSTGPGAVAAPVLRLEGLAISPRGRSALISIDGKPAAWLDVGASRDAITLISVAPDRVVIDTALGFKQTPLWNPGAAADARRH